MNDISRINYVVIVVFGLILAYYELYMYSGVKIKILYALVGLAWGAFYLVMLFARPVDSDIARVYVVRPLITITLSVMCVGAIRRSKNGY